MNNWQALLFIDPLSQTSFCLSAMVLGVGGPISRFNYSNPLIQPNLTYSCWCLPSVMLHFGVCVCVCVVPRCFNVSFIKSCLTVCGFLLLCLIQHYPVLLVLFCSVLFWVVLSWLIHGLILSYLLCYLLSAILSCLV